MASFGPEKTCLALEPPLSRTSSPIPAPTESTATSSPEVGEAGSSPSDPPHQQQLFADQGRRFLRGDNRARDSCQMHDLLLLNELNMPRLCRFARQRGHDAFAVDNQTPLAQLRDVAIAQH